MTQVVNEMIWSACGETHVGMIRKINQDAFVNLQDKCLWAVADGMGGHLDGGFASTEIISSLKLFEPEKSIGTTIKMIYHRLNEVNNQLIEQAAVYGSNQVIGSTIAILYAKQQYCVAMWSGDSRIYLFRRGVLKQLTRDHNNESQLLSEGLTIEEVQFHPYAQVLTHAIGGEKEAYLDAQIQEIRDSDIFLLCSDGLNKEVSDSEIEEVLMQMSYQEAMHHLMDLALQRGARDNVTLILVKVSKPNNG